MQKPVKLTDLNSKKTDKELNSLYDQIQSRQLIIAKNKGKDPRIDKEIEINSHNLKFIRKIMAHRIENPLPTMPISLQPVPYKERKSPLIKKIFPMVIRCSITKVDGNITNIELYLHNNIDVEYVYTEINAILHYKSHTSDCKFEYFMENTIPVNLKYPNEVKMTGIYLKIESKDFDPNIWDTILKSFDIRKSDLKKLLP